MLAKHLRQRRDRRDAWRIPQVQEIVKGRCPAFAPDLTASRQRLEIDNPWFGGRLILAAGRQQQEECSGRHCEHPACSSTAHRASSYFPAAGTLGFQACSIFMARPLLLVFLLCGTVFAQDAYPIVDTGQIRAYDARREVKYPTADEAFFGQDAHYAGNEPAYKDLGNGTVRDLVTGLVWVKNPGEKVTWEQAVAGAKKCRVGEHKDWRLPTIKELYSLILFSGLDVDPQSSGGGTPFLDTKYFDFEYGNPKKGERIIDSQWTTATRYVADKKLVFGVNFADGRIKGYGLRSPRGRGDKLFFVRYVRGNPDYGKNDFADNKDGTITDRATGLTWTKADSGRGMTWKEALAFAEKLKLAGHDDWRLPNAKELQSIVDYSRVPAIDRVFDISSIKNEKGEKDHPFFWTGTTHASARGGAAAVYVAFGRSLGYMRERWVDIHGAGSQRSDPKEGDPKAFPQGRGPQGDAIRILNYVRCVRGGKADLRVKGPEIRKSIPPRGGFVERLDRNGDGKVSRDEFDGPPEHFGHFDRNGDGYITEDEAAQGPPPRRR